MIIDILGLVTHCTKLQLLYAEHISRRDYVIDKVVLMKRIAELRPNGFTIFL